MPAALLFVTATVEPFDDLMPSIITAQASYSVAVYVSGMLVDLPAPDGTDSSEKETPWQVVAGALTYVGRIYVHAVDSLGGNVIRLYHEHPESGQFGPRKSTELVSRNSDCPAMD
jgi:hypothetical protein